MRPLAVLKENHSQPAAPDPAIRSGASHSLVEFLVANKAETQLMPAYLALPSSSMS